MGFTTGYIKTKQTNKKLCRVVYRKETKSSILFVCQNVSQPKTWLFSVAYKNTAQTIIPTRICGQFKKRNKINNMQKSRQSHTIACENVYGRDAG